MDTYIIPKIMAIVEVFRTDKNAHKTITAHNIPNMDDRTSLAIFAYVTKIIKDRQTTAVTLIDNSSIFQMNFLLYPILFYLNKKPQFNLFIQ